MKPFAGGGNAHQNVEHNNAVASTPPDHAVNLALRTKRAHTEMQGDPLTLPQPPMKRHLSDTVMREMQSLKLRPVSRETGYVQSPVSTLGKRMFEDTDMSSELAVGQPGVKRSRTNSRAQIQPSTPTPPFTGLRESGYNAQLGPLAGGAACTTGIE